MGMLLPWRAVAGVLLVACPATSASLCRKRSEGVMWTPRPQAARVRIASQFLRVESPGVSLQLSSVKCFTSAKHLAL